MPDADIRRKILAAVVNGAPGVSDRFGYERELGFVDHIELRRLLKEEERGANRIAPIVSGRAKRDARPKTRSFKTTQIFRRR